MNRRTRVEALDWVHPSWRDLVIDHLAHRPGDRQRFLSRCGIVGLELALSSAGGREGERVQPLLQAPEDWATLRRRALELIGGANQAAHRRLLATIHSLLRTAGDTPAAKEFRQLARDVLPAIVAAWNASGGALRPESLRLFYDASVQVRPLVAGPSLEATWDKHEPVLVDPSSIEWHDDVAPALETIEIIAQNEPRLLRQRRWPRDFEAFAEAVETLARKELEENGPLLKAVEDPDFDLVSQASDGSADLYIWIEILGRLGRLTRRAVGETRAELDSAMRSLDRWVEEYEERQAEEARMEAEYAELEDENEPEDPAASLRAIFTDL